MAIARQRLSTSFVKDALPASEVEIGDISHQKSIQPSSNIDDSSSPPTKEEATATTDTLSAATISTSNISATKEETLATTDKDSAASITMTALNTNTLSATATLTTTTRKLSHAELAVILECAFASVEEIFQLSDSQQWFRQRGLHLVKNLLRQTYSRTLSGKIEDLFENAVAENKVKGYIQSTREFLWPNGIWHKKAAEEAAAAATAANSANSFLERTDEDRADTRIEAKGLLVSHGPALIPGVEAIQTVVGRQNTLLGLTRMLNMVQHRDLNRGLICGILESFVKSILSV